MALLSSWTMQKVSREVFENSETYLSLNPDWCFSVLRNSLCCYSLIHLSTLPLFFLLLRASDQATGIQGKVLDASELTHVPCGLQCVRFWFCSSTEYTFITTKTFQFGYKWVPYQAGKRTQYLFFIKTFVWMSLKKQSGLNQK